MPASETENIIIIEPRRGWIRLNLREIWQSRDLLYFFIWRDLKVRYRQTLLGFSWALINPIVNTVVFTVIFGRLASLSTDSLPAPIFYMMGLMIWRYFSSTLSGVSGSLVNNSSVLTKVYFPRLLMPLNACASGLAEFFIAIVLVTSLMFYYGVTPAATGFLIPVLFLLTMACALGVGLFFASLNVRFRDIGQIVPFLLQIWMYVSVIVPFSEWQRNFGSFAYVFGLNPMLGIIEMTRWSLAHHVMAPSVPPPLGLVAMGLPFIIISLLIGLYYFKRTENLFADIV